jgi:hypothetical protein
VIAFDCGGHGGHGGHGGQAKAVGGGGAAIGIAAAWGIGIGIGIGIGAAYGAAIGIPIGIPIGTLYDIPGVLTVDCVAGIRTLISPSSCTVTGLSHGNGIRIVVRVNATRVRWGVEVTIPPCARPSETTGGAYGAA